MLLDFEITPGTLICLAIVAAWAIWAIRRMTSRGLCDCGDHCGDSDSGCSACAGCAKAKGSGSCSHCPSAEEMAKHLAEASS